MIELLKFSRGVMLVVLVVFGLLGFRARCANADDRIDLDDLAIRSPDGWTIGRLEYEAGISERRFVIRDRSGEAITMVERGAGIPPALLIFIAASAQEKTIWIQDAMIDGNTFLQWSKPQQINYVTGLHDGFKFAPFIGGYDDSRSQIMKDCTAGMTNVQLHAITIKFLEAHPERWHEGMHYLYHDALKAVCPGF